MLECGIPRANHHILRFKKFNLLTIRQPPYSSTKVGVIPYTRHLLGSQRFEFLISPPL